ncbi:MAG: CBS domain-containing protein [Candidatus Bathyarchaeia archaeon]|jgi:CBS domain-containing protein
MGTVKGLKGEFPSVVDRAYEQYKQKTERCRMAKDIMTRDVVTIAPEESMEEAAKIMGENHIGSLIVTKYDTPVGIVTERDLLSKVLAKGKDLKEAKVGDVMSYPLVTLCLKAEIKEAAQTMIKKKGRLAVFECGKLMGIITASDLIRCLPAVPETEVKVEDFMNKPVITCDESTPVEAVAQMMGKQRIGSVIVTSKEKSVGIFTERDLLTTFLAKGKPLDAKVGDAATSPLITAPLGTSVHKAAATMALKHIRRLPIAKGTKLIGVVTARDLVEAYAK